MIYRLANQFEQKHGVRPNLLYLSPQHLERLKSECPEVVDQNTLYHFFKIELVVGRDVIHPHVAWSSTALKRAV
ncbi:hypothetical protein BOW53_01325 [Solemya pervernicosa gill symbiont]|uniref:Uncharacterized protein n=2 Tax=Gammaproteobacteria incertae sedis TaxID=118884 RepID=A0A1T2LA75_9GAMM|nr:hypothetical protein [Candidatus Reidiella endopervernicosa]OOZ42007.1 hypothetical protein BOW53_01325 [Solemya pervernicosa gill symbiont]QKQ27051.1 hypothetical protein HUE57_12750 [Candidatus Reidiella endopervernicosa]